MTDADGGRATGTGGGIRQSFDLVAVALYAVVAYVVLTFFGDGLPTLRAFVGVPLVLFAPGYAIVSALLPVRDPADDGIASLDRLERVALAFGTSIAVVLLGTLAISFLYPAGLATVPFVELLAGTTVLVSLVAIANRRRFPVETRDGVLTGQDRPSTAGSTSATVLEVALAISVVLAVGAVGSGFAMPREQTPHTTATLLTEGQNGEPVADGYVEQVERGEQVPATLSLKNREGNRQTYTVIVALERIRNGSSGPQVVQRTALNRGTVEVPAGETVRTDVSVSPDSLGEQMRLSYYIYKGDPGEDATPRGAYRHLFLWVTVTEQNGTTQNASNSPGAASHVASPSLDGDRTSFSALRAVRGR